MFPLKTLNLTDLGIGQKVWAKLLVLENIDGETKESFCFEKAIIESIHFGEISGEQFQCFYVRTESGERFNTDEVLYSKYHAEILGIDIGDG